MHRFFFFVTGFISITTHFHYEKSTFLTLAFFFFVNFSRRASFFFLRAQEIQITLQSLLRSDQIDWMKEVLRLCLRVLKPSISFTSRDRDRLKRRREFSHSIRRVLIEKKYKLVKLCNILIIFEKKERNYLKKSSLNEISMLSAGETLQESTRCKPLWNLNFKCQKESLFTSQ